MSSASSPTTTSGSGGSRRRQRVRSSTQEGLKRRRLSSESESGAGGNLISPRSASRLTPHSTFAHSARHPFAFNSPSPPFPSPPTSPSSAFSCSSASPRPNNMSSSPPPSSPRKSSLPSIRLPAPPPSPPVSANRPLGYQPSSQPVYASDQHMSDPNYATQLSPEDEDDDGAQYAMPMDDPYAEVEHGWRRMSEASGPAHLASAPRHHEEWRTPASAHNDEVVDQLSGFSFANPPPPTKRAFLIQQPASSRKFSLPAPLNTHSQSGSINLSMRRSDQPNLFRPPSSSVPNKSSFSLSELVINQSLTSRARISSFSTELEPISGSPTSPDSPMPFPSETYLHNQSTQLGAPGPPGSARALLPTGHHSGPTLAWKGRHDLINASGPAAPSSSSSSSFCSSSDDCLLRRASCSSLASAGSVASSNNGSTSALKARRGSKKPLSLAMPPLQLAGPGSASTTATSVPPMSRMHLQPSSSEVQSAAFRSLPPSPRFSATDLGHTRDQIVGMKANVTGGLSMKRRTSIPRLSLGGISSITPSLDPHRRASLAVNGSTISADYARLLGRNSENVTVHPAATPVRLHFDPVAAEDGKHELMSSQAGSGGKGHIERPAPGADGEPVEEYPYQYGPREVLPGLFLGSEQNARDARLLLEMGFGYIVNVAKEVECPWTLPVSSQDTDTTPSSEERVGVPVESQSVSPGAPSTVLATPPRYQQNNTGQGRTLLVRPTASTPNLHRSFKRSPETGNDKSAWSADPSSSLVPGQIGDKKLERGEIAVEFEADDTTGRPALEYRKLPWSHDQDGLAAGAFEGACEGIDQAIGAGKKILVHCQCGVSRSATLVIAYCMRRNVIEGGRGRMHELYTFVKDKSPWAGPNMGLIYQLIEYEKVLKKSFKLPVVPGVQEEDEDEGARTPTRGGGGE